MENLANRIIEEIEAVFRGALPIGEFDIIPVQDSKNHSPVIHADGNLALESWCVPTLYMHAYTLLMKIRRLDGIKANIGANELDSLSRILLLLNPDVATIWNMRKELLTSCDENLDSLHKDFLLTELVLTRKPKNSEAFMHRRWLLRKFLAYGSIDCCAQTVQSQVHSELRVCTMAASRYPNNYVAWNHREWVHDTFKDYKLQILCDDLIWSKEWVAVNISDHSGFQFRQYILGKMVMNGESRVDIHLKEEKETVRELINYYPGHEALWYHYKSIMLLILECQKHSKCEQCKMAKEPVSDVAIDCNHSECRVTLLDELEFVDKSAVSNSLNSWQIELASRCKRWILHLMQT